MKDLYIPRRWLAAILCHIGYVFLYATRVNLSIAIVAMVNNTHNDLNKTRKAECHSNTSGSTLTSDGGTFEWDEIEQGYALSSFYYGYLLMQIPAGLLSKRFGGKRIFALGLCGTSIMALLVPTAARLSLYALVINRIIDGFFQGVTVPAAMFLLAQWSPANERSRIVALASSGMQFGVVLTFPSSAFLSSSPSLGWASSFYFIGSLSLLYVGLWMLLSHENPQVHPKISEGEKMLIVSALPHQSGRSKGPPVPWRQILSSPPVLAATLAHFCNNWTFFLVLTGLPSYFKQVLGFNLSKNGLLSTLPFITGILFSWSGGWTADLLQRRRWPTTRTRKTMSLAAFVPTSVFLVAAGYAKCGQVAFSVFCLAFGTGCLQLNTAGFITSMIDVSPKFSGILTGVTNTAGTLAGCLVPIITGYFIEDQPNREQYQKVFGLAAGIAMLGAIVFTLFGSGEIQPWDHVEVAVDVDNNVELALKDGPDKGEVPDISVQKERIVA